MTTEVVSWRSRPDTCACLGRGSHTEDGQDSWRGAHLPCAVEKVGCECEFDLSCPHSVLGESPENLLCPQSCLHGLCGGSRATVRATRGRGGSKQKLGQRGRACFTAASGRVRAPRPTPGTPARPLLGRLKRWAAGQQVPLHQEWLVCAIWCHQRLTSSETVSWRKPCVCTLSPQDRARLAPPPPRARQDPLFKVTRRDRLPGDPRD